MNSYTAPSPNFIFGLTVLASNGSMNVGDTYSISWQSNGINGSSGSSGVSGGGASLSIYDEGVLVESNVENIDFNNYKGIYADDEGGEKYTCPETGAHFEPKDLCKRIYKIIEKRKPFEMELYG